MVPLRIRSFEYKMALKPFKPATMRFFFWKNSTNSGITTNTPPEPQNHVCQGKCIPTYCMIRGVASNEYSLQCRHMDIIINYGFQSSIFQVVHIPFVTCKLASHKLGDMIEDDQEDICYLNVITRAQNAPDWDDMAKKERYWWLH